MAPVLPYTTSATKKIAQLIPIASRTVPAIKRPLPTFSLVALSLRRHKMRCWMVGAIKKAVANAVDSSADSVGEGLRGRLSEPHEGSLSRAVDVVGEIIPIGVVQCVQVYSVCSHRHVHI